MAKPNYPGLLLVLGIVAGVLWVLLLGRGPLVEALRVLFWFGLAIWGVISSVVLLVQWFRMRVRMSPEDREVEREFYKARRARWQRLFKDHQTRN